MISLGFMGVISPYDTVVNVAIDQYNERKYYESKGLSYISVNKLSDCSHDCQESSPALILSI